MVFVSLIAFLTSFAMASVTLGLSIVYAKRTKASWAKIAIVLASVLLGIMAFIGMKAFSIVLYDDNVSRVISIVFDAIICAAGLSLVYFIPYLVNLILRTQKPGVGFWIRWSVVAVFFLASGVLNIIFSCGALKLVHDLSFLFVFLYSAIRLWHNKKSIADETTGRIIIAVNIVSYAMVPFFVLQRVIPGFEIISYSAYYLAFSSVMYVFYFNYFSADFRRSVKEGAEIRMEDAASYGVSEREFEVIKLIEKGYTNKEIGDKLCISVNTVNNHVSNIFSKCGVSSRIDLLNLLRG